MKCQSHYPILGNCRVIRIDGDIVTYQCPVCDETYSGMRKRGAIDWRPDSMKEEGAKYAKDTLQPRRGGDPSLEYIQAYPEQAKKEFTPQEIKGAKPVWSDLPGVKSIKY